jgi:hypothetical protein
MLRSLDGRAEGDPRKIADVIVKLANSEEVPVRLILGVDAEKRVQQAEAARASEAAKWRELTVSTVFEDGRFDSRLYTATSRIESRNQHIRGRPIKLLVPHAIRAGGNLEVPSFFIIQDSPEEAGESKCG